jgi:CRISPR-associated protein Cas1
MFLFRQRYSPEQGVFLKDLGNLVQKINAATDLNEVRGLEGAAARKTFRQLNTIIDVPEFHIHIRERKAPDPINSLLNFGYYLLFSRINATMRASGLNPYLGFLHSPEDNYESLVSDMVELFRARIDRFLVRLINLKVISKQDFVKTDRGYYLTRDAIRRFLMQYETEMEKKGNSERLTLKQNIHVQVQVLKSWAEENRSLQFYTWDA